MECLSGVERKFYYLNGTEKDTMSDKQSPLASGTIPDKNKVKAAALAICRELNPDEADPNLAFEDLQLDDFRMAIEEMFEPKGLKLKEEPEAQGFTLTVEDDAWERFISGRKKNKHPTSGVDLTILPIDDVVAFVGKLPIEAYVPGEGYKLTRKSRRQDRDQK